MDRSLPNPAFVASLAPANPDDARRLVGLVPPAADAIEIRLDRAPGELSPRALLALDPRCLILTLRSAREGGAFRGSREEYRRIAQEAYDAGAVVDVEIESGLLRDPAFLPDRRRVVASRHGASVGSAEEAARDMDVRAAVVKRVAEEPAFLAGAVSTLAEQRRASSERPCAVFAVGDRGAMTRVLGARFGSALVYGSVEEETAGGQLPIRELLGFYRAREASDCTDLFAVYGGDVAASLSPRIHNTLFARRRISSLYIPARASNGGGAPPMAPDLEALESTGLRLQGVSVTNPFKAAAASLASPDRDVAEIGAANTIVRKEGPELAFDAFNTDAEAVAAALDGAAEGAVLVLGSGGAAAASLHACRRVGRRAVVVARNEGEARELARRMGAASARLGELPEIVAAVLVNATPLGTREDDPPPFPATLLAARPRVMDFVYRRFGETPLARAARSAGCDLVDGRELLARQAVVQARRFGVADADLEEIRSIVREEP